jgi:hydrogenase 3 maturation protease
MQADLQAALKKALTAPRPDPPRSGPVVVLGVGSDLRSDDGAGPAVARAVAEMGRDGLVGIPAGPAPENATAAVRALAPSHVIIVDAADMDTPPGTVRLLDAADAGGASFATHGLPLSVLADYLRSEIGCAVHLVGIQPATLAFGETLSPVVGAAVRLTVEEIARALG